MTSKCLLDYHVFVKLRIGYIMRNSSMYRSNISGEKVAYLSEIKNQKELEQDDNAPKAYKRPAKEKEIDLLWQNFITNPKEERSPGVYLLTGFIAGALCVFIMNAIMSISSNMSSHETTSVAVEQPKYEKKISRKNQKQINPPHR